MAKRDVIVAVELSLCLIASSVQGSATKVTYCDKKANYDVKVKGLEITPYPVARGNPATFSILATTGEKLRGGKVLIEVSLFGVHIHSETHELCSETSCPVFAGDFVIAHSQVLPGYTPPGSYSLKMKIVDESNHQLTCIGFQFSIGLGSESDVANHHRSTAPKRILSPVISRYEEFKLRKSGDVLKFDMDVILNSFLIPVQEHSQWYFVCVSSTGKNARLHLLHNGLHPGFKTSQNLQCELRNIPLVKFSNQVRP